MYRSLARRLNAWFGLVAIGLLIAVALVGTAFAFSIVARNANEAIASAAGEVPALVSLYAARGESLPEAAPGIVAQLRRPGIHVVVFDENRNPIAGRGRSALGSGQRAAFALGTLLGIRFQRVDVPGGAIGIGPDPDRLRSFAINLGLGLLALILVFGVLAWGLARYVTGQALRPLVEVTSALEKLAQGDFSPRVIAGSEHGEFRELTVAYNAAAAHVSAAFEERRRTEAEMRQFVADAGHELRTPLTVVMGYIDVLQKGAVRDPQLSARIFETMTSESRRMRRSIDKLIVLARLERPVAPAAKTIDLAEVAGKVVESYKPLVEASRIRLEAQPGSLVCADESELHEAIANLLENALKYAPASPVDVSVSPSDGSVIMRVADKGPGLTPEEQARIFDRFYRGADRDVDGSGLGLAIAKRVVERANGTIDVDSAPGTGTRFTIRLPSVPK